jgi:hypothetical protein
MTKGKKLLRCDHGCRLDDLKDVFEKHCDELDEALTYSVERFVDLAQLLTEEVVPYLEYCALQLGDESAHDLLIDINRRIEWV